MFRPGGGGYWVARDRDGAGCGESTSHGVEVNFSEYRGVISTPSAVFYPDPWTLGKWRLLGGCQMRPEGPKIEAEAREQRWGSWGGGSKPHSHLLGGMGERCELPRMVRGRAPTGQRFSIIFNTQLASPDTIILLIVGHKKLKNSYTIQFWVNYCEFGDAV